MNLECIKFFAGYIESQLGIVYSDANFFQLENRLNDVAKSSGLQTLEELWEKTKHGVTGDVKQLLLDAATNNETSFFRDPGIFRAIESYMLPDRIAQKSNLRIWSTASSTGQEPYTLAILFSEMAKKRVMPRIEIVATDISDRVLARARAGAYSQLEVQRGMPASLLIRYFTKTEEKDKIQTNHEWTLNPEIRSMVSFQKLNLLEEWGALGDFDMILCRNVLIYQSVENKKKILARLTSHITPKGFLVLGAAESLLGLSDRYDQEQSGGTIFYRKKDEFTQSLAKAG